MHQAHQVATVRAAEQELMRVLPEGALMQRAAAGLAAVCAGLLPRVYGARVVVLAGSGDNGGDALYVGARLARRGARVVAVVRLRPITARRAEVTEARTGPRNVTSAGRGPRHIPVRIVPADAADPPRFPPDRQVMLRTRGWLCKRFAKRTD